MKLNMADGRFVDFIWSVWWTFHFKPVNPNVANPSDNYDEKKFHEHFWLSKTAVKCLIDVITVQLHEQLYNSQMIDDITTRFISFITSSIRVINHWLWQPAAWPLWLYGVHAVRRAHVIFHWAFVYNFTLSTRRHMTTAHITTDYWLANRTRCQQTFY